MMMTVVLLPAVTPAGVTLLLWQCCLVTIGVVVVVVLSQTDDNSSNTSMTRIIGGTAAGVGEFPAFVHPVQSDCKALCGGILVHEHMFLMAAHCQGLWLKAGKVAIGGRMLLRCGNDATNVIDVKDKFNHCSFSDQRLSAAQ
jgi:Trypsin